MEPDELTRILTPLNEAANIWRSMGASVRFRITDMNTEVVIGQDGQPTSDTVTHTVTTTWPVLRSLIEARMTFLEAFTGKKISITGPVFMSLQIGQFLPNLGLNVQTN